MKKLLVITFILAFVSMAHSQSFSYSFDGHLDLASLNKLEKDCAKLTAVQSTKVKYKEDVQKGELIIVLKQTEDQRAELDNPFKVTDIKQIIIDSGLTPGDFRKLKN